ncbi:hypothetical protein NUW58_g2484 [Xylaria curta]|uniref:Uncharacterized protein n=1 Tax=Xylaria curta TaxID=42375 RepID=A0ACC1PFW1_9PEZI|nr:hypothetical protein NUW58_g2484 [Xylaria curta]
MLYQICNLVCPRLTRNSARSLPAAERRALAGENDSQDSQAKLLLLIQEHGIGGDHQFPNSPGHSYFLCIHTCKGGTDDDEIKYLEDASDTSLNHPNINTNTSADADADVGTDDAIPQAPLPTAPLKKRTGAMSSQSPTQTNEGRSYEQYARDGSQPSSPPRSLAGEHRTLQEGDTGYLVTTGANHFAPETPAALPKPFLAGGNGQVMPPSQLFGQTQPTSGLKKASPTSSRPSPNVFGNNVTSPTQPTSSPLKNRGFGATPLPTYISTSPGIPEPSSRPLGSKASQSPSPVNALGAAEDRDEDELDKTPLPRLESRRGRNGLEPIDEYRPYRKQGLESDATKSSSQHSLDSDFERDEAELRRRRAKFNKERASKSFPEISVPLPSSGRAKIEVPSTNRAKRLKGLARTDSEEYIAQCHGKYATTDNDGSQETVVDSQDIILQQKSTNETDTPALPAGDPSELFHDHSRSLSAPLGNMDDKEMIPETSPTRTFAEPPKLIGDIMRENSSAPSGFTLSYPIPSAGAYIEPSGSPNKPLQLEQNVPVALAIDTRNMDSVAVESSPSIVLASPQQSVRHRSGRLNNTATPSSTAPEPLLPSDPGTTSSALTVLSATPTISSSSTSSTEDYRSEELPNNTISVSSPSVERRQRRGRPPSSMPDPSPSLMRPKTYGRCRQSFRKATRQSSRHSSLSLDELDKLETASTMEDSRSSIRKPPRKSTTLREFQTKHGIFEGMVFAISFQERQQSQKCKGKSLPKSSLEDMIRSEGGAILDDGFNALFEVDTLPTSVKPSSTSTLSSSLSLLDSETGFTALIADGHSRKVKFMQALALGIPCLAPKWITTCVSKREIIDWSSYLLCAGSSALLGDAIRSRNLSPYDASTARLAHVISKRPKLLNESKILLIMKKTKNEEKRLPYVFLAQVLGASLVRVHSLEEARARLRESESRSTAFDWVYVDDHLQDAKSQLFGSESGEGVSKKRKRTSIGAGISDQPPKRIRILNDELVVQSLILGRLMEEDELEG